MTVVAIHALGYCFDALVAEQIESWKGSAGNMIEVSVSINLRAPTVLVALDVSLIELLHILLLVQYII